MSYRRITDLSSAIDHIGHRHRLPSKRKLDDYASVYLSSLPDLEPHHLRLMPSTLASFLRSSEVDPPPLRPSSSSPSSSSVPPSSSTSSSSLEASPTLQFFVRSPSRTLVLRASPHETVESVIGRVAELGGFPTVDHRLLFRGRQLDPDCPLVVYDLPRDATLQLVPRLRSTPYPRSWQVVNELVWSLSSLCRLSGLVRDKKAEERSSAVLRCRTHHETMVDSLVKEFLTMTPAEPDDTWGHLLVFVEAGATAALVRLYHATDCRGFAEKTIRLFLCPHTEFLPKCIQHHSARILLEFCKLLAGTAGRENGLYLCCRSTFGTLLEGQDSRFFSHSKSSLIDELYPFLNELMTVVLAGLSSENMYVSQADITEFSNFLHAMKRAIWEWIGGCGEIPKSLLCSNTRPQNENWIGSLHSMFMQFLQTVDQCLKKVEDSLAQKGPLQSDCRWNLWSHILVVLTEVQVFSGIYEGGSDLLHSILLARRSPLNALIKHAKRNDKLRWILKHKDITDFESRRNLVLTMFPEGKDEYDELHEMLIDRSQLLAESFEYISQAEPSALHGGLFMEFKNEEATGPGVLREWFCLLCRAIFNPQNVLFLPCPNDRRRFYPNPTSVVDPLHLKYFVFCGRIIALALMHKVQAGIVFDRVFFLQLAGKDITLEDVRDADPSLYMSCKQILDMEPHLLDSDVLGLTFVREFEELGTQRAVELCNGGKDIVVNSENRERYVSLLIHHRFVTSTSEQIAHFARGFGDILSSSDLRKFFFESLDLEDFDQMLGGSDSVIDMRDWKAHTEYNGYKAKDRQIGWFWKIVEGMSVEQQRVLLFFWTSVKYLPVDGFGGLASKLYIYRTMDSHDRLPTSHTCFFRLCLPAYPTISMMRDRLQLITQEHVCCTFGIW